jgi:hypothetical protein
VLSLAFCLRVVASSVRLLTTPHAWPPTASWLSSAGTRHRAYRGVLPGTLLTASATSARLWTVDGKSFSSSLDTKRSEARCSPDGSRF